MGILSILRVESRIPRVALLLLSVGVAWVPIGCATGINSPSQPIQFFSEPPAAAVWVDGRFSVMTPGKVSLSRLSSHHVRIEKEGYQSVTVELDRGMSLWTLLDIVCLLFVVNCIHEDIKEGGFYSFDDDVQVTLTALPAPTPKSSSKSGSDSGLTTRLGPTSEAAVKPSHEAVPDTTRPDVPPALPSEAFVEPEPLRSAP